MYEAGNFIGYWGCIIYLIVMAVGLLFVMNRYLKDD
jgi:hypothetical protein